MRTIIVAFLVVVFTSCSDRPDAEVTMKEDIIYLASDSMQGRRTGTPGELMAADYIASRFEQLGLSPKGADGYFQDFSFKSSNDPHQAAQFVDSTSSELTTGRNVVGYWDNQGDRTVVIGAHYDHLGLGGEGSLYREGDAVHNGADDNASGVAMMLKLAQQVQTAGHTNNYLFIAFSGEELGLLGSSYYVKNTTVPIEQVTYMINLDMVGRLNEEQVIAVNGVGTSPIFKQTLMANNNQGLVIKENESGIGPSDFTSFYLADVPVLSFFTGQHEDYHKPGDDSEKINYPGMYRITDYIFNILTDLDDNGKLAFRTTKNESEEVPRFKVVLGVVPDYLFTGKGMRIDGVSEDKPAQKAGLQKGDIVRKLDTISIDDMMSYMRALSKFEEGQRTQVTVDRDGEMMTVEVEF